MGPLALFKQRRLREFGLDDIASLLQTAWDHLSGLLSTMPCAAATSMAASIFGQLPWQPVLWGLVHCVCLLHD